MNLTGVFHTVRAAFAPETVDGTEVARAVRHMAPPHVDTTILNGTIRTGDKVMVEPSRPYSARKNFKLLKIIEKAQA